MYLNQIFSDFKDKIFGQNLELLVIVAFMHGIKAAANAMWPYWHFSSVIKSDIKARAYH